MSIDVFTDKPVYDKDLTFDSKIDWTQYQEDFFNRIVNNIKNVVEKFRHELEVTSVDDPYLEKDSWLKKYLNEIWSLWKNRPETEDIITAEEIPLWLAIQLQILSDNIEHDPNYFEKLTKGGDEDYVKMHSFCEALVESSFLKRFFEDLNIVKKIYPETLLQMNSKEGFKFILGKFVYNQNLFENQPEAEISPDLYNAFLFIIQYFI